MFTATNKKGRFTNDSNFILDFRFLLDSGYYFEYDPLKKIQIKRWLKDYQLPFVLSHWNKPETKIGLWDSTTNLYINPSLPNLIQPHLSTTCYWLEMPNHDIKPSCVLFYPNARIKAENGLFDIVPSYGVSNNE